MDRHFLVQTYRQFSSLVLFCYSNMKLEITGHTSNMISCKLYDVQGGQPWFLYACYGPNHT